MERVTFHQSGLRGHFQPIMAEWVKVISRFTNNFDNEDALYWYNERATLSTLASAAAICDCHVLEEYRAEKRGKGDNKYMGRADLYLACGRTEYIIESKQLWVSISRRSYKTLDSIILSLKDARKDAAASNPGGVSVLGALFVVPYIPPKEIENKDELIDKFIKLLKGVDYDVLAYVFPEKAQTFTKKGKLFPGVACLLRAPRRLT